MDRVSCITKLALMDSEKGTWEAEAEVYEESSFIKSLGLPTRMQDRNIYGVKLNDNLEVQSYERKSQQQQKEG